MTFEFDATYENGVLRPSGPLDLPDQTQVHVTIVPQQASVEKLDEDVLLEPPLLTVGEFQRILSQGVMRGGSLPVDFDRDDIYSNHD